MFTPISTERLLLRPARVSDTTCACSSAGPTRLSLSSRTGPCPTRSSERRRRSSGPWRAHDSPSVDGGLHADHRRPHADSIIYGDINIFLEDDGRTSGVGYSITPAYWGRGFASEALAGVLDWLFDVQEAFRAPTPCCILTITGRPGSLRRVASSTKAMPRTPVGSKTRSPMTCCTA